MTTRVTRCDRKETAHQSQFVQHVGSELITCAIDRHFVFVRGDRPCTATAEDLRGMDWTDRPTATVAK